MRFGYLELAESALAGCGVGFLAGLFGIGGAFLLVPVLNIVIGMKIEVAIGAAACQVLGPATTSILARRIQWEHLRLPLTISGGLFAGVFSGAHVLWLIQQRGEIEIGGQSVSLVKLAVLSLYFALLILLGTFAVWEVGRRRRNRETTGGWLASWRIPPYAAFGELDGRTVSITTMSLLGLVMGFVSGLLGISGGLLWFPALVYLFGMRTHKAVTCSIIIVWIVAAQATIAQSLNGFVELPLVMALLFGGTIGARLGTEFNTRLGSQALRRGFGWLLIVSAVVIAGQLVQILSG